MCTRITNSIEPLIGRGGLLCSLSSDVSPGAEQRQQRPGGDDRPDWEVRLVLCVENIKLALTKFYVFCLMKNILFQVDLDFWTFGVGLLKITYMWRTPPLWVDGDSCRKETFTKNMFKRMRRATDINLWKKKYFQNFQFYRNNFFLKKLLIFQFSNRLIYTWNSLSRNMILNYIVSKKINND